MRVPAERFLKMLTYKNFIAVVQYATDDQVYWGKVIDTDDLILFHGNTMEEAEKDFHEMIDLYLNS